MNEIVCIQVGQGGNQIGTAFWEALSQEHGIGSDGKFESSGDHQEDQPLLEHIGTFFNDRGRSRYVPRVVLADLEPGTLDVIKASPIGGMFNPDNFVFGVSGAGNNFARGHYTDGAELIDEVLDIIRQEAESCDSLQGFLLFHSLGGGTGSGLGTLIVEKLREDYPNKIVATVSVFPSPKVSDVVVEPYNATLAIHRLIEHADLTFCIDNEALYNISHNVLKQTQPRYSDLNRICPQALMGITAPLRLPMQAPNAFGSTLREMATRLVPFPRLHFLTIAHAPLFNPEEASRVNLTVRELTRQMWSSRNCFSNFKPEDGKYLAAHGLYRGNLRLGEVEEETAIVQQKRAGYFVDWIPDNVQYNIISHPPTDMDMSATLVFNTTATKTLFQRIGAQFAKMYRRKAFLHWYKGEGMDEMEFQEADKNVRDLVTEYQEMQDAVVDIGYEYEEED